MRGLGRKALCWLLVTAGLIIPAARANQDFEIDFHMEPFLGAYFPGEMIRFEAVAFVEGEVTFFWDFGDGNEASGALVDYAYDEPGPYQLSLFALKADGACAGPLYQLVFVNPTEGDFSFSASIVKPAGDVVVQAGSSVVFEAEASAGAQLFVWQIAHTDLLFLEQIFSFTPPQELTGNYVPIFLNAVSEEGIAGRNWDVRTVYVFGDNHPPVGRVVEPENAETLGIRMKLGEEVSLRAAGEDGDGDLPLRYFWEIGMPDGSTEQVAGEVLPFRPQVGGSYYCCLSTVDAKGEADPFGPCISIFVKDGNREPAGWIETGSMTVDVNQSFTLSAGGDDADGDPLTFLWDLGDGRTAEGVRVQVSYGEPGVYQVGVTADDGDGGRDLTPFRRWVFVNDPTLAAVNQAPIGAIVSPEHGDTFALNEAVSFSSAGYDHEDQTLEFFWDFDDGSLAMGPAPQKRYTEVCDLGGVLCPFYVTLFARDAGGLASYWEHGIDIAVYAEEKPPDGVILAPIPEADPNQEFVFEEPVFQLKPGEALSLRGGVAGVANLDGYTGIWFFYGGGEEYSFVGFELEPIPFEAFPGPGDYTIQFLAFSPSGLADPIPAKLDLWVRDGNTPPMYVSILEPGWDLAITVSDGLDLAATAYDEEGDAVSFDWRIMPVGGGEPVCLEGERVDHLTFDGPGLYEIQLTAVDSEGAAANADQVRFVAVLPDFEDPNFNEPPYVEPITPTDINVLAPLNTRISFACRGVDIEDEAIAEYFWSFGNGLTASTAEPGPVLFDKPGFYEVKAYAKDASGIWSPYPNYWAIYIYGTNIPPKGTITAPPPRDHPDDYYQRVIPILRGGTLTFSATATDADGHLPLQPSWYIEGEFCEACGNNWTTPALAFDQRGVFHVNLDVEDRRGEHDPFGDFRTVKVVDPNLKPESFLVEPHGDLTVEPGEELYFFGFGEDPNDLELAYEWDFGPATIPEEPLGDYVFPVVFNEPSPPDQPYLVSFKVKTIFTQDPTPATIRVRVKRFQDTDFEPNNRFEDAKPLQQGTYNNLSLDTAGDTADYFVFEVAEAEKDLKLNLSAAQEGPLHLRLFRRQNETGPWLQLGERTVATGVANISLENVAQGHYAIVISLAEEALKRRASINYGMSLHTLEPSLFMPFLVEDGNLSSSIGLINTTASEADIVVVGLDERGRSLISKSLTLVPNGRFYVSGLRFFGKANNMDRAREIRWVKVASTQRLVGYTNATTRDRSQLMSVGAVSHLSSAVLAPHIARDTRQWYTRAILVNVDEEMHPIDFKDATQTMQISPGLAANHQMDFRFSSVFQGELPRWGEFKSRDGKPTIAGFEMFGRVDGKREMAALEMVDAREKNPNFIRVNGNLYFTHVAKDTASFWTGISLINMSSSPATYNLVGYDDDGQIATRLDAQILPPGGKLLDITQNIFGIDSSISWLMVETDDQLAGFELFGDWTGTRLAGFKAANATTDTLYFPHIQVDDVSFTGINLLNLGSLPVDLEIRAFNDRGEVLAEVQDQLGPFTKMVKLAQDLFAGGQLPPGTTYLRIKGNQKSLAGFQLFGSLSSANLPDPQMAGLPALTK